MPQSDRLHFTRLRGRKYDLSGQDYRSDFGGLWWEIESSRTHGGGRAIWFAHAYARDPEEALSEFLDARPRLTIDEYAPEPTLTLIIGYGRKDLEAKMATYANTDTGGDDDH